LGIGDWGLGPKPQTPTPNTPNPNPKPHKKIFLIKKFLNIKNYLNK